VYYGEMVLLAKMKLIITVAMAMSLLVSPCIF